MLKKLRNTALAFALVSGLLIGSAFVTPAYAQAPGGVEVLEALVIEGKLQKPEVFYILSRHKTQYSALKLKRSFLKQIRHSLKKNPF